MTDDGLYVSEAAFLTSVRVIPADMDLQVIVWFFHCFLLPTALLTGNFGCKRPEV